MRLILSCLTAVALTAFASGALGQVHVFDIDTTASSFSWSGTTSLGPLVGNPSNTFNLLGTVDMDLTGTQPTTAGEFLQSDALVTPDISAAVPNPFPFLPPLATIDIANLRISVTSPQFPVAAGAFTADITFTALSGVVTAAPLGGAATMTDLTGLVSTPAMASGTITRVLNTITLNMPVNSTFPISVMNGTTTVTGSITLLGTIVATTTAIDPIGASFCNGDGGNQMGCTNCPCMNNAPPGTIGGCLNRAGTSTAISATGDTSASLPPAISTDLRFTLSGAPPNAFCVMISGSALAPQNMANMCVGMNSGVQSLEHDGLRCAVMNLKRHGGRSANGMGDIMDGSGPSRVWGGEAQPGGGLAVQGGFVSGQTRYFQVTHREDVTLGCMRGLNTSQALEITFTP